MHHKEFTTARRKRRGSERAASSTSTRASTGKSSPSTPAAACHHRPRCSRTTWDSTDMESTQTVKQPVKYDYDRIPYLVAFQNNSDVRDVYGGLAEITILESYLLKPKDKPSDTVLVFMHPIGGGAHPPMIHGLARARPH